MGGVTWGCSKIFMMEVLLSQLYEQVTFCWYWGINLLPFMMNGYRRKDWKFQGGSEKSSLSGHENTELAEMDLLLLNL